MKRNSQRWCCFSLFLLVCQTAMALAADAEVPPQLAAYVARPDPSFAWRLITRTKNEHGIRYELDLTSQTWQGIVWKHALAVYEPARLQHPKHVLFYVSGGSNEDRSRPQDVAMGTLLAQYTGARVAVINQVPNQPLFDGRKEDDLITETWLRFLKDGDANWPLLFPMVKSAVRGMDAVQALAQSEWNGEMDGFVISGGSKRGWTSWLAAAVDKRLVGTAPLVIDVLNFRPHMDQQLNTWGKYSEQIADYSTKGLIKPGEETPRERQLREMMDPYSYLPAIQIPVLLVHGTNDPYWCVDATRFYWDDIVGPKYVLKLPNAGHGLETNRDLALSTLAVFFRQAVSKSMLPSLTWRQVQEGNQRSIVVTTAAKPVGAQFWSAESRSKDFRASKWLPHEMRNAATDYVGTLEVPADGHVAYFGEMKFEADGLPFSLSTLVFWE